MTARMFEVTGAPVKVPEGTTVSVSRSQYLRRKHALVPMDEDFDLEEWEGDGLKDFTVQTRKGFLIKGTMFKKGEVFGLVGKKPGKKLLSSVRDLNGAPEPEEAPEVDPSGDGPPGEDLGAGSGSGDLEGDERIQAIQEAITQLPDEGYTNAGLPRVKAVSELVGFKVSSDELTEAWEAMPEEPDE